MATLSELLAQKAALDAQIEAANAEIRAAQNQERQDALTRIAELASQFGLTSDEIAAKLKGGRTKSVKGTKGVSKGSKVAPKYRDEAGNTWSGRGIKPRWLAAAIAAGKSQDDFKI
jgi:DNA-binding protein H-NS